MFLLNGRCSFSLLIVSASHKNHAKCTRASEKGQNERVKWYYLNVGPNESDRKQQPLCMMYSSSSNYPQLTTMLTLCEMAILCDLFKFNVRCKQFHIHLFATPIYILPFFSFTTDNGSREIEPFPE